MVRQGESVESDLDDESEEEDIEDNEDVLIRGTFNGLFGEVVGSGGEGGGLGDEVENSIGVG